MADSRTSLVAGPSNISARDSVPPPGAMKAGASFSTERLRIRLSPSRSFFPLRKKHVSQDSTTKPDKRKPLPSDEIPPEDTLDMPFVQLGDTVVYSAGLEEDYTKDVYRWAVLYENQRGITLFSTPYYSSLSLLPMDPPAFTIPSTAEFTRHSQPTVSLSSYPLPDGYWRWVSRSWMVGMRGNGQTQYDGFEYNWLFRSKHWRSEVGTLSAGGWVRRRRWVRLMMRPATLTHPPELTSAASTPHMLFQHIIHLEHHEVGMTRPPSVAATAVTGDSEDACAEIWRGDEDSDWERCHVALRKLGTDGRQLELWRHWLAIDDAEDKGMRPAKQRTGDEDPPISTEAVDDLARNSLSKAVRNIMIQPDRHHIAAVLRTHGADILQLLIYPDSRTHFLELITVAGLLPDLNQGAGVSQSSQFLSFYSSSQSLQNLLASQ